jgi:L-asparaginase
LAKTHIHIIKTGGTIEFFDPTYDATMFKKLMKIDVSIEGYFKNILKPHFSYSKEVVAQKDSRELTDDDREKIAQAIIKSHHKNILITHGTFTMVETLVYLRNRKLGDKKIILTGSMIPLTGFSTSDAGFNIGFSVASFANVKPGVYISMNGNIFDGEQVVKNIEKYRFE